MSGDTSNLGSLLYQTWKELVDEGRPPPVVRTLPLGLSDTVLRAQVKIEQDYGYYLMCGITTTDTSALPSAQISLRTGTRNLTPGFVPRDLVMTPTSPVERGWYRPVVVRPSDVIRIDLTEGFTNPTDRAAVFGMYPGADWEPPGVGEGKEFLESVWLQKVFNSGIGESRDQSIQVEWDGMLYDWAVNSAAALSTSSVTGYIDNTKFPVSEGKLPLNLISSNSTAAGTGMLMAPISRKSKLLFHLDRSVASAPEFTVRAGKPWWWAK